MTRAWPASRHGCGSLDPLGADSNYRSLRPLSTQSGHSGSSWLSGARAANGSLNPKIGDDDPGRAGREHAVPVAVPAAEDEADLVGVGDRVAERGRISARAGRSNRRPIAVERRDDLVRARTPPS